jgi:hypothetical protein
MAKCQRDDGQVIMVEVGACSDGFGALAAPSRSAIIDPPTWVEAHKRFVLREMKLYSEQVEKVLAPENGKPVIEELIVSK